MFTPTAILVVVGSEVLSAKVLDENGPWAARRLRELGVRLLAIHTVPDEIEEVAEVVERACRRADWVFTSGGVGPTHDDVTVAAVARALGRRIVRCEELVESLRAMHRRHNDGAEAPDAVLRMADVPEGTRLLGDASFPTLVTANVVMLPGVPQFFRFQFDRIAHALPSGAPFVLACVYLAAGEGEVAPVLDRVARQHPTVEIGSYPRFDDADHRVKVTVESKDAGHVVAALAALLSELPPGTVVRTEGP